ncbi:hypothetical protein, conserved in T. vivax, (fragment), partial [Trypanosoma vivax Y486]
METSVASAAEVGRCLRGATGLLPNNGHSQRLPCLPSCVGRPAPPLSCKSPPLSFESLRRTAFREKQRSSRVPQQRLGLAIVVVVFALRQCNEAPSQPGGFPFYSGEGHPPSPPQVIGAASRTTPTLSISLASGSPILKFGSRLDGCGPATEAHCATPRRTPQGLVVEAAPWPLQRQSPLFLLGGRSGNPSAPQSAAAIKKRHWHPAFARGPCGRTRQFDHARRALLMRAVNFAELFKTAAQCPGHRAVPHGSPGGPARFPSCVGALGPKSRSTAAAAACTGASGFV